MLKLLIVTTDKSSLKWKSLDAKLLAVRNALGDTWTVEVQHADIKPLVLEERVDHSWFKNFAEPYLAKGYDMVGLHMSDKQRKDWKIKPTLRGSNLNSGEFYGDFYFWADENTKRGKYNQYVQTMLHEVAHEFYQKTKLTDKTHAYHDKYGDITGLLKTFDWSKYSSKVLPAKKTWLEKLIETLKGQVEEKPVTLNNDMLPLVKRQADKVLADMKSLGHEMRIVQGYRSIEEQNKLYGQGRTYPGAIITNAKGGESFHNYGVACDFVFRKDGYNAPQQLWQVFGIIGKKNGFEWGGDWKEGFIDMPHLEMKLGYTLKQFQQGLVDLNKYK